MNETEELKARFAEVEAKLREVERERAEAISVYETAKELLRERTNSMLSFRERAEKAEAEIVYYKKRESIFEAHTLNAIKDCEKAEAELNRVMNDLPDVHHIKWECGCVGRYPSTSCPYCHVKAMQKKRNEDHEAECEKWRK